VAPDAKLSLMEIKWGLVPDMGAMLLLPRLLRDDVMRDLVYTGRIFSGEEALNLGVATRVCADPLAEALAYAREIAGKNPDAIQAAKRLMTVQGDRAAILQAESDEQMGLIGSPNQREAVRAALAGDVPRFI
jgi:enoyl-CoA hydratase/carnithine racemase